MCLKEALEGGQGLGSVCLLNAGVRLLNAGISNGDSVTQPQTSDPVKEDENTTIHCQYEATGSLNLFWYIQECNKAPQHMLGLYSSTESRFKKCFSASHDKKTTQGQFVNQSESSVTVKEKENETLPCSYKDPPTDFYMFWYIQTGSQAPGGIYSELVGDSNLPSKLQNRLSASHDKTGKTFHLILSSVDLSDSSVYFCALQPTARESAASAIQ
ncbi:UNVERIFIED_CONTAM: hypothetical protein FKN15_003646 [Acipenser sinensis]